MYHLISMVNFAFLVSLAFVISLPASAQQSTPPFDWRQHQGDITKLLAAQQKGQTLSLGAGQIQLTQEVTLKRAVAGGDGKLHLVLAVAVANQTVTFEGLAGASGQYNPSGAQVRPIVITQTPHTEKFLRKGELWLAVPKGGQPAIAAPARPVAEVAQRAMPDAPTRNKEHAEYTALARHWTQNYTLDGTEVFVTPPHAGAVEAQWRKELEARQQRVKEYDAIIEKARRGEYTRTEKVEYVDTDGRTRERTVTTDNNAVYGMLAMNARMMTQGASADALFAELKRNAQIGFEIARQNYWRGVLPAGPAAFAGPISKVPLLTYRYDPFYQSQADERYWAKHLLKNASGKTLHNVTLAADLFHFSTDDVPTTRHVYFVPVWKAGQELELSRWFVPEAKPGVRYQVPKAGHVNDPPSPELDMIGGVLRMDVTLWADEARQEATAIRFPERVAKIAPELLRVAEHRILHPAWDFTGKAPRRADSLPPELRPRTPATPKAARPPAEQFAAEMLAPILMPVVRHLPPGSEHARRAMAYLADPVAARATIRQAPGK